MTIDAIQRALLESYQTLGGINHINGSNLPSDQSINWLAAEIMHLLFPGFFESKPLATEDVPKITAERLKNVCARLEEEIAKALSFAGHTAPAARASELASEILLKLPMLRQICRTDVQAAYEGDPAARSVEEIILAYPCVLVISIQRFAHELYKLQVPLIPRMLTEYAHERTGTDLHPGATIGTHFFIDHCTGVVVGETTRIGNHVKIYQNVTLGAKSFELDEDGNPIKGVKRHPDIEDHVTIYPSATVLGGKTVVGRGSIIGSNVWLMKSVPAESIVYYEGDRTSVVRNQNDRKASRTNPDHEAWDWTI
ncbi:serine O-acetyltransferase [Actomonas aquatica]|uniref:Serine O-acetyltransferase n=1 Tax=Actomonas aquatica TaxID=2866162 RepID=A0ABZ1CCL9_9BACT|nr:serine O-acetyltransferase [Opitutus sp. WL0086]WRQ89176.1 serine O-acetyltransferase [Opitutus sp. WL0086]